MDNLWEDKGMLVVGLLVEVKMARCWLGEGLSEDELITKIEQHLRPNKD